MFCNSCGRQVPEGVKFCPGCGKCLEVKAEPVKAEKKPLDKKKWIPFLAGILAGALVVGLIFGVILLAGGGGKIEGAGYGSAADAAKAYLNGMKAGDVKAMAATFAVESYVEHYDSAAYIDRLRSYTPAMEMPAEPSTQWLKALKIGERQANVSKMLQGQYLSMSGIAGTLDNRAVAVGRDDAPFANGQEVVDYFSDKDWQNKLNTMKIGKVLGSDEFASEALRETYEKNLKQNEKVYGCDDIKELAVKVEFEGEDYLFFFSAGRYNGKWYLINFNSILGAMAGLPTYAYGCIEADEVY